MRRSRRKKEEGEGRRKETGVRGGVTRRRTSRIGKGVRGEGGGGGGKAGEEKRSGTGKRRRKGREDEQEK